MPRAGERLSPAGWALLCAVAEAPTHGFAVAALFAPEGDLGRVWSVPRALVYRELSKLVQLGLVTEGVTERTRHGPRRTILTVTASGRSAGQGWLTQPVEHVRDMRSALLLKLALLSRAGLDARPLLEAQQAQLLPQVTSLEAAVDRADGFERLLTRWRVATSSAALQFVQATLAEEGVDPGSVVEPGAHRPGNRR